MRDAWLLEYENQLLEFSTEDAARKAQDVVSSRGISSQLYHERHILIREPISWVSGG